MCVLLGYGADAVCPYLVFETVRNLRAEGILDASLNDEVVYKVCKGCKVYVMHLQDNISNGNSIEQYSSDKEFINE